VKRDLKSLPDASDAQAFFGREIKCLGIHYTVNQIKADRFTVWKEGDSIPYNTMFRPYYCDCPDWLIRRRSEGTPCKHHRIVEAFLAGNSNCTLPNRIQPASTPDDDPYNLNTEEDDEEWI
jgi:hypothetical protein